MAEGGQCGFTFGCVSCLHFVLDLLISAVYPMKPALMVPRSLQDIFYFRFGKKWGQRTDDSIFERCYLSSDLTEWRVFGLFLGKLLCIHSLISFEFVRFVFSSLTCHFCR